MPKWGHEIAAAVLGVLIGAGFFFGVGWTFKALKPKTGATIETPVQSEPTRQLLIEASEGDLVYRASSINLQDGSELQKAIMAEQPANMARALETAGRGRNPATKIHVTYTRTATAGPLTSLLKSQETTRADGETDIRFAAGLFNALEGADGTLSDIFHSNPETVRALDTLLCGAVRQAKEMRSDSGDLPACETSQEFSFLNGAPAVFLQSDRPNTISGIRFYFEAGRIGRKKEGLYVITLRQSDFIAHVRPEYKGLFSGAPAR